MRWNATNEEVTVDGAKIAYARFGQGKRVLVVLPGLSDGLMTVRGKARMLAPPYKDMLDDFTVCMFSRRDTIPDEWTIEDMADDQAKALHNLGIRKACVLGVSQGGMIAQCLARDHGKLIDKLVLAVTAPEISAVTRERVSNWMTLAIAGNHHKLMMDTAENSYSPAYLKKMRVLSPLMGIIGRPRSYARFVANGEAILGFEGIQPGDITCPTLVIGGDTDKVVGYYAAQRLHEYIPGSVLHVYEGLGHAVYEEAPDFYQRVYKFIKS